MKHKIYAIKNKINDKIYIGATSSTLEERFSQHKHKSKEVQTNNHFYRAIQKYGVENFYIELLDVANSREEMFEKEIYYIDKYETFFKGYNSTLGGEGAKTVTVTDGEILQAYERLKSSIKVSLELGIGENTVIRRLKDHDIPLFGSGYESTKRVSDQLITETYYRNRNISETARELGVSISTISNRLKLLEIDTFKSEFSEDEELEIVNEYLKSRESLTSLGESLKISRKTISKILIRHGINIETRGLHLVAVVAEINNKTYHFESVTECAKFIIGQKITRSTNVKTVTEGINRSIRVGVPYYNMTFIKP